MKKTYWVKICAAILTCAVLTTGCGGGASQAAPESAPASQSQAGQPAPQAAQPQPAPAGERVLTMAVSSDWGSLNPLEDAGGSQYSIVEKIYDRLFDRTADGELLPRLAKKYEVSDDYKTITLFLDENAKWHDGVPVTAEDLVWTFNIYTSPDVDTTHRNKVDLLAGTSQGTQTGPDSLQVKALDEHTVEVNLSCAVDPMVFFTPLRYFFVLPKHVFEGVPLKELKTSEKWRTPIGSGPLKYSSDIPGERIEFLTNQDYHLGACDFDKLVIRVVQQQNMLTAMMSGEIDIIGGPAVHGELPISDIEMAKEQPNIELFEQKATYMHYMPMNTQREYLKDKRVREAINLALDKEMMVQTLIQGHGCVANAYFLPEHKYYNEKLVPFKRDVERAKQLLQEAGWDPNTVLEFTIPTGNVIREQAAVIIQQNLAEIGVKTSIRSVDFPTLMKTLSGGETDLGIIGNPPDIAEPSGIEDCVNPTGYTNFAQVRDPRMYEACWKAKTEAQTFEERKKYYDEFQEIYADENPCAWLFGQNSIFAYNKDKILSVNCENFVSLTWRIWEWDVA